MLRFFLLIVFVFALRPFVAQAQIFTPQPLCVTFLNTADHEILASVQTDKFTDDNNNISYHDFVFRLQAGERRDACSTGPFFEGQKLRLVLKTSFPVYSCKFDMNRMITITSMMNDQGERVISADCPSERDQLLQQRPAR